MKNEKPAPDGADFPEMSNEPRHQEATASQKPEQDTSQSLSDNTERFFLHPLVDELGLKPSPFRVYCHLLRRAGSNGFCKTSIASIGSVCGLSKNTVDKALKTLKEKKLISSKQACRSCNRYTIPWPPPMSTKDDDEYQAPQKLGRSPSPKLGHKVSLYKKDSNDEKRTCGAVTDSEASGSDSKSLPTASDLESYKISPKIVARASSFTDLAKIAKSGAAAVVLPDLASVDFSEQKFQHEPIKALKGRPLALIANERSLNRSSRSVDLTSNLRGMLIL